MQENVILPKTSRNQFVDALRGFAMLLVVFVHVEIFSINGFGNTTLLANVLSSMHMPLFFFISGLCTYRPGRKYGIEKVRKDVVRLILPACLCGLIYTCFKIDEDVYYFLSNPMKAGYWFTISMFEMLIIYYIISNTLSTKEKYTYLLWGVAIALYMLKLPLKLFPKTEIIGNYLCLHQTCNYFVFFVAGVTCARNITTFHTLIFKHRVLTAILILFILCTYVRFDIIAQYTGSAITMKVFETLAETVMGILGTLFLYALFLKNEVYFSRSTVIGKGLMVIGVNTLPVYLLHYFLLVKLPMFADVISKGFYSVLQPLVVLMLALIVITISILFHKLLTLLPLYARIMVTENRRSSK